MLASARRRRVSPWRRRVRFGGLEVGKDDDEEEIPCAILLRALERISNGMMQGSTHKGDLRNDL